MVYYVIRRLLWMVPTLLAMALITFTIMHLTPGSPLDPIAENANPLITALLEPSYSRSRVEHCLTHRLNCATNVRADKVVCALELWRLAL